MVHSPPAVLNWVYPALVFVADFAMTRGFASGMRSRERALESSVNAAEEVGELLAGYRTRAAAALVGGGAGMKYVFRRGIH